MGPKQEQSLKRGRGGQSQGEQLESKKPRRSNRIESQHVQPELNQLPSPVTHQVTTTASNSFKEGTEEPPEASQLHNPHAQPTTPPSSSPHPPNGYGLSSPPNDTQLFSQFIYPPPGLSHEVEDEEAEGVWGYLIPVDGGLGETLVLRRRTACPLPKTKPMKSDGKQSVKKTEYEQQEAMFEQTKIDGTAAGGYLIGRHPECDRVIHAPTISNRHCLFFSETKAGNDVAVVEDLSGNGTFVNEAIVGRNKRRELREGDEIAILDSARFIFRYPRNRDHHGFNQQYAIQTQLGKGHFATVYLCVEKCSGMKFAVKKFEKRSGPGERSKIEGLQQEIGVLKGVSHPNLLCLKDVFDEGDGVYLVLELAVEGELFNWIVMKQKLSEAESRKLFIQIFQSLKYLHERNIVHRDIKPENILLVDRDLSVKLADFGLAKIIGEESFTTTLCGTPSYVAPEILESSNHRRYTKAVDIWSAGVVLYICLCGFPPFSDELYSAENPYTLSQQIKLGRFDYPSPYWDPVSDLALDLIDRMLTVDVERRISIDGCLEHPWLTNSGEGNLATHTGANGLNTQSSNISATDSTDGLASALTKLDFSKRKLPRERTLISSIHDVKVVQTVLQDPSQGQAPIKIFAKNENESDRAIKSKKENAADKAQKGAKSNEKENAKQQKKVQKKTEDAREMQAKAGAAGKGGAAGIKAQSAGKALQNGKKAKNAGGKREATPAEERDPEVFAKMGGRGDEALFGGR